MKRRVVGFLMVFCMMIITLSGCGKKEETNNTVNVNEDTVVDND